MNFALYRITTPIAVLMTWVCLAGVARGALKATKSVCLLELTSTGLAGHNGVHNFFSDLPKPFICLNHGTNFRLDVYVFMSSHFTLSSYIKATYSYVCV